MSVVGLHKSFPRAARSNNLVFIKTGRRIKSETRHQEMPPAQRNPEIRTGTNEDSTKIKKAAMSIPFASTMGLPVRSIVSHITHPSSAAALESLDENRRSATDCRYRRII